MVSYLQNKPSKLPWGCIHGGGGGGVRSGVDVQGKGVPLCSI